MPDSSATSGQQENMELIRVKNVALKRKKIIATLRTQNFRLKQKIAKMSNLLKILSHPVNKKGHALTRKQATEVSELVTDPENTDGQIVTKEQVTEESQFVTDP